MIIIISQHGATQAILDRLHEIPILADAVIAEEYTSPDTKRPVLTPVVSVGVKSMEMLPVSHERHTADVVMRLTLLFPCGLSYEVTSADMVYEIGAAFAGRKFENLSVFGVTVEKTTFDASMYGVAIELDLHMKGIFNQSDPLAQTEETPYRIGSVEFDRFPEKVTEARQESSDATMAQAKRVFTLEGSSIHSVGSDLWNTLHTQMHTAQGFSFSLPRSTQTVTVRPARIETVGDTCGRGFTYKLVFTEV